MIDVNLKKELLAQVERLPSELQRRVVDFATEARAVEPQGHAGKGTPSICRHDCRGGCEGDDGRGRIGMRTG